MASSRRRRTADSKGELIRDLRIDRGLTQEYVAGEAGISVGQLSRIECGKSEPNRDTVERLAPILGVTPAYLDVRALSEAVAERATDPGARMVLERILAMHDRIAIMSEKDRERLFKLITGRDRGSAR